MSEINTICDEKFEISRKVLIQNGQILESECEKKKRLLVLNTNYRRNIPKIILFPGEYLI